MTTQDEQDDDDRAERFRQLARRDAPAWVRWNDATVPKMLWSILARNAVEELPILADALEDAGCPLVDAIAHFRSHHVPWTSLCRCLYWCEVTHLIKLSGYWPPAD